MRVAVVIGPDRPDHDSRRALARRDRWPLPPRAAEHAVGTPVLRRAHPVRHEHDLAAHRRARRGLQVGEAVEPDDLGGQPARRGRPAVAERGDRELLRKRCDDLRPLLAAHPDGHVERLHANVGEAQVPQLRQRPGPRARLRLGARHAGADLGGEALGDLVGERVGQRRVAELRDPGIERERRRRGSDRRRLRERERGGGEGGCEEELVHDGRVSTRYQACHPRHPGAGRDLSE